jgi:hypothetical protein
MVEVPHEDDAIEPGLPPLSPNPSVVINDELGKGNGNGDVEEAGESTNQSDQNVMSLPSVQPSSMTATTTAATDREEDGDDPMSDHDKTIVFQSDWTKTIASPNVPIFSPSRSTGVIVGDNNRSGSSIITSLHGLGLRLAIERSRNIGKFLRNDAGQLLGAVSNIYDQFGIQLLTISKSIRPQQLGLQTAIDADLERLYTSTKLYSNCFRGLAAFYKTDVLAALQSKTADNTILIDTTNQKYEAKRSGYLEAHQIALNAQSQYFKTLKEAERIIARWAAENAQQQVQAGDGENDDVDNATEDKDVDTSKSEREGRPWEKALTRLSKNSHNGRLIQALKEVEDAEKAYTDAAQKENASVDDLQQAESLSLQTIQLMEQDRLNFYASSVIKKIFQGEAAVDGTFVSSTPTSNTLSTNNNINIDWERSATEGIEKTNKLLANLFGHNQSLPYEQGQGAMEADTLGLPPEIGSLRDQVKSKFAERETRIKTTTEVVRYLNEVSMLCKKAATALEKALQPRTMNSSGGNLVSEWTKAASVFGAEAAYLWVSCINAFFDEAKLMQSVMSTTNTTKIENWLANASRTLQNEIEIDDTGWKLVCDSSRSEMRHQSRYLKQQASISKARERISSVSSVGRSSEGSFDSTDETPRSPSRSMNTSIDSSSSADNLQNTSNRGRILLFKGGEALKKLQENARVQIAKTKLALDEADQKEANLQQAAEEALEAKERAVAAYKNNTEARIEKFAKSDEQGWSDLKVAIDELISFTASRREERRSSLEKTLTYELRSTIDALPNDVEEFLKLVKERIDQKVQALFETSEEKDLAFYLEVDTSKPANVKKLLDLTGVDESLPDFSVVSFDTSQTESPTPVQYETNTSSQTEEGDISVSSKRKLMHRAMTAPAGERTHPESDESFDENNSAVSSPPDSDATKTRENQSPAMMAFVKYFWSKKPASDVPEVLGVYQCSYKPKDKSTFLAPNLHGHLYTTKDAIYFLSWDNKNFMLIFSQILTIQKEKGFMGASNDNAIAVTYTRGGVEEAFTLGKLESRDSMLRQLQALLKESEEVMECVPKTMKGNKNASSNTGSLPPVPHDRILNGMEVLVDKTIKNSTIKTVFETVWADKNKSFYREWLKEEECFDIIVPSWTYASDKDETTNGWCKESYDMERLVEFKFKRTTHLYIGPPIASVKQKHYCRVEGDDRIVVAISAAIEGIPYADSFEVEVRWIARRIGANDVKVDVGSFVVFKKSTMLKSQIKAGTITESQKVHERFFEAVRRACSGASDVASEEGPEEEEQKAKELAAVKTKKTLYQKVLSTLRTLVPFDNTTIAIGCVGIISIVWMRQLLSGLVMLGGQRVDGGRLDSRIDELQAEVRALRQSIDTMIELMKKQPNK